MNTCPATFIRANYFSTPLTNSKNQLARINVAGHVFINEIHRVVFPHFRVILRTDRPMALCQTLSPAPKKGKGRQRETTIIRCAGQLVMVVRLDRARSLNLASLVKCASSCFVLLSLLARLGCTERSARLTTTTITSTPRSVNDVEVRSISNLLVDQGDYCQ